MTRVFISHSSLDRDFVEREIVPLLRAHGVDMWYSIANIDTAAEWERQIHKGLMSCDWFLVVLSPRSVTSDWVQREVHWADIKRKGRIIPVMLETCDPDELHIGLLPLQYIDFRNNVAQAQDRLLAIWGLDNSTQVMTRHRAAEEAVAKEDWATVIENLEVVLRLNPAHSKAHGELKYARQQQELADLYGAASTHLREMHWREALEALQRIQEINSTYKDVPDLMALVSAELEKEEAERLYRKALAAAAQEDWTTTIELLQSALECDPSHADAQAEISRARQKQELADSYAVGLRRLQAGRWREALVTLRRVRTLDRNYRDVANLIADADAGLAGEEERLETERMERRAKEEAERLYSEVLGAIAQEDWTTAREGLLAAQVIEPNNAELAAKLIEIERQQQLASIYEHGLRHFKAGRRLEALEAFGQVQEIAEDYKDVPSLIERIEAELKRSNDLQAQDTQKQIAGDETEHHRQFNEVAPPVHEMEKERNAEGTLPAHENSAANGTGAVKTATGKMKVFVFGILMLGIFILLGFFLGPWGTDHGIKAKALLEKQKYAEAEAEYKKAIKLEPNKALFHSYLGDALFNQKKYVEAEVSYRKAVEIEPTNGWFHNDLGNALNDQKKYVEAEASYRKAVEFRPAKAKFHNDLGDALFNQKKHVEAEVSYRKAVEIEPTNGWFHNDLGNALNGQKKYAEAEASYRKATESEPNVGWFHHNLGDALNNLGNALNDRGKYAQAEVELRKAVEIEPTNGWFHNSLGHPLYNQRKYAEAEAAYRKAVEIQPVNAWFRNNLGDALINQQKYVEAEAEYRKAVEIEPNSADFHNDLGSVLSRLNKRSEAEEEYKKARDLRNKSPTAP